MSDPGTGDAPPAFRPARINQKKRDGGELSAAEIAFVVDGVKSGRYGDAQLGAFLMAVCKSGMTRAETATLTLAMRDSGRVMARCGEPTCTRTRCGSASNRMAGVPGSR